MNQTNLQVIKSVVHNIGVIAVGFLFAFIGVGIDRLVGFTDFQSFLSIIVGVILLTAGFLLRVWAAYHFYMHQMKVIALKPQSHLITDGPYKFSRNPLYLGGNVFIFLGASIVLGTPGGVLLTILHLPFIDLMIRREERQLEASFGAEWRRYTKRTRRWI